MKLSKPYSIQQNKLHVIKLRKVIRDLPRFCVEYFRGIEPHTSILTRINYAYDLRLFLIFLQVKLRNLKVKKQKILQ